MKKRILVVHYSQSGQLTRVLDAMLAPLRETSSDPLHGSSHDFLHESLQATPNQLPPQHQAPFAFELVELALEPLEPFPFPWPFFQFLDVFPESVQLTPRPLKPLPDLGGQRFDLVILGYQAWYLSPSQPMTAFLQSPQARAWLRDAPVVTVVACRNMWLMAQEKMKRLIAAAGGRHCDHVALTDPPAHVLSSFVTTPRWLLRGRRDAFWGLPQAGIAEADIAATRRFGRALRKALAQDAEKSAQPMLRGLRAASVQPGLIMSERAGHRAFVVWSRLVRACGAPGRPLRRLALLVFVTYLVLMIVAVVPVSLVLQRLLRPLLRARLARWQAVYEAPSGAETYNMPDEQ